ncbi:uncharacterized protein LOC122947672 isoform X3 [Acropora millepora]|uniref:uncharacterized protein LOC122947672 isoform X3 n=1 Tax=Acropora millepora TaxID=45264 RepID=UPI001CF3A997|nr:uncharacterized protein LOC122947672 isoform X3 [Acropora millepora]
MVKMPVIVLSLSLLCFTVNANSQSCVEETLDCNKAVPTVFKLSDASCPCDDASHSGVLKFSDNEVHVCAGTVWNMVHLIKEVSGPYGSEGNPGQSCDDIYDELVKGSAPEDGIYWLRFPLPANGEAFPVFCDMKNKGWTMVFKAVSGIAKEPWKVFSSEFTSGEIDMKGLDLTNNFPKHYKSRIIMFWESFNPAQAQVTFHKGGSVRKALTFNAQNSNFDSWFRQERLTNSSWSDLISFEAIGVFSLNGPCSADGPCQNLLVNKHVEGPDCNNVFGWIYRGTYNLCNWEANTLHDIVYCNLTTICQFKKQDMEVADFAAVFITRRK